MGGQERYVALSSLLIEIEAELRTLQRWEAESPSKEALSSLQPFCIDTLSFTQWLQFVFIPRLRFMIESRQTLPRACNILPVAEEYFGNQRYNTSRLLQIIGKLDAQFE